MNPVTPTPFSFSLPEVPKKTAKELFALPESLPPAPPSTNALALSWLASTIDPETKLVSKDMAQIFSQVYFLLVAEGIGKTPRVQI
jgi:hypothetical protein